MPETIRILLVDDHQLFIDGIVALLAKEKKIHIAGSCNSGKHALDFLRENDVDLVITDISMPEMEGTELVREIKKEFPAVQTLVLSMMNDTDTIEKILMSESEGYILKNTGRQELVNAIQRIHSGSTYYSEEVTRTILKKSAQQVEKKETPTVSAREKEIIKLIVEELSSVEIADKLNISIRTVDTHRKNILHKTGCKTIVGLIKYAYAHNLT
ncbi:MAG TPA: response regulator transcription factor [Flavobacteriales bacterium]|nr:response regulator transcription factor [Flavobacteriales bacterium]